MEITSIAAKEFGVSRQSVSRHLRSLVEQGFLTSTGKTRDRKYRPKPLIEEDFTAKVSGLQEDTVWREEILPHLDGLPPNIISIFDYGFTEMLNNVIDHSDSDQVAIHLTRYAASTKVFIKDRGVGIFNKIQSTLGLNDPPPRLAGIVQRQTNYRSGGAHGRGDIFYFQNVRRIFYFVWGCRLCSAIPGRWLGFRLSERQPYRRYFSIDAN